MRSDELTGSWALTAADLRWVLDHADLPSDAVAQVRDFLLHNELGEAWTTLDVALPNRAPDIAQRMDAARERMGMPA